VNNDIEIHALLRHRPGDFFYDDQDLPIFIEDMKSFKKMGVKGVVVGCLNKDRSLHRAFCQSLADQARDLGLECSFHRAFDFVAKPFESLEFLIDLGFKRVLSSGQKKTAFEGRSKLSKLVQQAKGRIEIMAGSGVNVTNALEIAQSGVDALHYTAYYSAEKMELGMGARHKTDYQKIKDIPALF
jgi:copper homeostasis protein